MIWGASVPGILWQEAAHFGLGFCSGLLAYSLTRTILSHISKGQTHTLGESGIRSISLLAGLCFCVFLHVVEDYTLNVF